MKVAVVGVTGLVGGVMLEVLKERNFPVTELIPVASKRSVGKQIEYCGKSYTVIDNDTAVQMKDIDIALFSAGGSTSKEWAPKYAANGTFVIDNSSAWRMEEGIPLVVPEINTHTISSETKIIANPNCSTIQMVVALAPLEKEYGLKRLVISTYQSFTGTGKNAVDQYEGEKSGTEVEKVYPHPIFENCLPHCDVFYENGYTREELKLVNETRKILGDQEIAITATAVRVPVFGGHSEAVNVEFQKPYELDSVNAILNSAPGIVLEDEPKKNKYPMPLFAYGKDDVFVGRLRRDDSIANGLNMWIVSDNLRKGAATNAVQIAEYLKESIL